MSLVANFRLVTPLLRAAVERAPAMRLTVVQEAALDRRSSFLTFWASGGDFASFEAGAARDETITDVVSLSDRIDNRKLYRVEVPAANTTYWKRIEEDGVLLRAIVTGDGWEFSVRFPSRESVAAYREHCRARGMGFSLDSIYDSSESPGEYPYGLTKSQYEILVAAVQSGHFEIPRETMVRDLATRFDISDQAASERLRRSLQKVLTAMVIDDHLR